uniref:Uncharacterized protein n=1 Tax=Anguilla anguilla TaxID=7936 RepID=A0A0E9WCI5_ANGAN
MVLVNAQDAMSILTAYKCGICEAVCCLAKKCLPTIYSMVSSPMLHK